MLKSSQIARMKWLLFTDCSPAPIFIAVATKLSDLYLAGANWPDLASTEAFH